MNLPLEFTCPVRLKSSEGWAAWKSRRIKCFESPPLLSYFTLPHKQTFPGRISADENQPDSHVAINGRSSLGSSTCRGGPDSCRCTRSTGPGCNAGCSASCSCCADTAFHFRSHRTPAWLPPATFDAGPFGKLSVNGILTGFAQFQNNPVSSDDSSQATLTNGQVFIQKADGNFQWYVQAGAYSLPTLSVPFTNAQNTVSNLYGPVPVAWAKINSGKNHVAPDWTTSHADGR